MARSIFLAAFLLVRVALAADSVTLSGKEAEAVALAIKMFKSKQGSTYHGQPVYGDLSHYRVEVERHGKRLEISFVPEFGPKDKGPDGMTTVGGGTQYGWVVDYVVSLNP
jgi:hypothetical protein